MRSYSLDLVLRCIDGSNSEQEAFTKLEENKKKIFNSIHEKSPLLNVEIIGKIYSQAIYYSRK